MSLFLSLSYNISALLSCIFFLCFCLYFLLFLYLSFLPLFVTLSDVCILMKMLKYKQTIYFCKETVASCTIKTIAVVYFDKQMFASQNHALESIYEIAVASNLDKTSLILLINSYLFPELIHCPEAEFKICLKLYAYVWSPYDLT